MDDTTRARVRERVVPSWGATFLEGLRASGDERAAARSAGVTLKTARNWRTKDPAFREAWDSVRSEVGVQPIRRRDAGEWRPVFLARLRATGTVRMACRAAGISRTTAYDWREADEDFARDWDEAIEDATDALEAAARARALSGSDKLLMFLLKAMRPDKYGDRLHIEHSIERRKRKLYQEAREQGMTDTEAREAVAEFERIVAGATGGIGGVA